MKKIILILVLCFTINNIKAQQFSGYYEQPSSPNDIVINTAITNFVSTKMLKIDTYIEANTGFYYFELTFLADNLDPVGQSIRYGYSSNARLMINDVKYDIDNNCYIACGYINNNGMGALIISFDNTGMINWKTSGFDFTAQRGANDYRRVEVCNLNSGTTVYATCGYGTTNTFEHGVVGFYDQNGSLLSMYKSTITPVYKTKYTDLVFNPDNNHLALVGTFIDEYVTYANEGYFFHEYDLTIAIPAPITPFYNIRYGHHLQANAIDYDYNSAPLYKYYISGSNTFTGELFLSRIDFINLPLERMYPTYNLQIDDLRVSDNCMNNPYNKLGVSGYCISPNGVKEGFMAEIDLNIPNLPISVFSKWSGNNPPYSLPFNDACFQHIKYRDNMAITTENYSYILYGLPQNPTMPFSYISEYYPDPSFWDCSDILNFGLIPNMPGFNIMLDQVKYDPYFDVFPNFNIINSNQLLKNECNNPLFSLVNNNHNQLLNNSAPILKSVNGIVILNDEYTNAECNILNIDSQLINYKERGKQIINTENFKSGIYLLKPLDNSKLKPLKFYVIK